MVTRSKAAKGGSEEIGHLYKAPHIEGCQLFQQVRATSLLPAHLTYYVNLNMKVSLKIKIAEIHPWNSASGFTLKISPKRDFLDIT